MSRPHVVSTFALADPRPPHATRPVFGPQIATWAELEPPKSPQTAPPAPPAPKPAP